GASLPSHVLAEMADRSRPEPVSEPGEEDDSDQACAPTKTCVRWGCGNAALRPEGEFYVCPKCRHSYGRHPHPDLPPVSEPEPREPLVYSRKDCEALIEIALAADR